MARADGSGREGLTPSQFSTQPDWSPDSRRLAVTVAGAMEVTKIAIVDAGGSPARELDRTPTADSEPRWSPDGRRIAYVKDGAIHVMRADGSGDRRLTRGRKDAAPAWSPDGAGLSFVRDGNLHLMRATGSGSTCLRVGMRLTSGARWRPAP